MHSRHPSLFSILAPVILLAGLFFSPLARADDLFGITATGTSSTVSASGSSVISLIDNVTSNEQQFASLSGQAYTANLNYAGIKNAVILTQSFDPNNNKVVTVSIPSTGLNKTFSAANGSINGQIKDFLKSDGLASLTAFQAIVNRTSPVGAIDGNPLAATAMLTDAGYQEFSEQRGYGQFNGGSFTTADGHGEGGIYANGGVLDAGGISGKYADVNFSSSYFADFLGLSIDSPLRWISLRGSNVFMGGLVVGLPISLIPGHGNGLSWKITPAGHGAVVGSADFASGGVIYGGQVSNSLSYGIDGWTFTLANTAGYFHGADISIAGYDFNTRLNQWDFKNGLQLSKAWQYFSFDIGASWTNFLHATYIDGYLSPEAGIGLRFGKNSNSGLRIGYLGNFGNGYNTNGGNILLYVTN